MQLFGFFRAKRAYLEAEIVRADGTVEKLGIVAYSNSNPLVSLLYRLVSRFAPQHKDRFKF